MDMLSFELSAIDLILVIAVVALVLLYWARSSDVPEPISFKGLTESIKKTEREKSESDSKPVRKSYTECPRGFGNIRKFGEDGSVSDQCLGCYKIMDCYAEREELESSLV